jgi:hypothetical protein
LLHQKPLCSQRWMLPIKPQSSMQVSTWARREPTEQVWHTWVQVWQRLPTGQGLQLRPMHQPVLVQLTMRTKRYLLCAEPQSAV